MSVDSLKQHITNPLNQVLSSKLSGCFYHDVCTVEYLTTNEKGVDIIAHQLELVFDNEQSIFISWDTVKGWEQYTLSVALKTFTTSSEKFSASKEFWKHCKADFLAMKFGAIMSAQQQYVTPTII